MKAFLVCAVRVVSRARCLALAPLLLAAALHAQSVRWEPSDSGIATSVQLVFENCAPDGDPQLPNIPGATLSFVRSEQQVSAVNFQVTRFVRLTYLVQARQNAPVQIPAFTVKTDKGPMRVREFTTNAPSQALEALATAKLIPERASVWAGEVFGLTYELSVSRRSNLQNVDSFSWTAAPLVAEDWSKAEITESITNGDRRVNWVIRTRALARSPNTVKLEAASQVLTIQTGTVGTFFGPQPRMEQVSVTSEQPTIEVKPLPVPPNGFSGAVGNFELKSKVVPEKAAVGEPITWTVELSGTGNWPDVAGLPPREVSSDFQVVQPKAKRTPAEGKLFDVTLTEDVVLVPTKAGSYTLGPISFTYFDPKSGSYKTKTAPRTTITVAPPAAPQFSVSSQQPGAAAAQVEPAGGAGGLEPPASAAATGARVAAAPSPAGIPRDPLPGTAEARVPLAPRSVLAGVLTPFVVVFLVWLYLAVRRAKLTDPARPRHQARDRLARTLSDLQTANDTDRPRLLLAWQRDAAVLWQLAHAAPPPSALPDQSWATLWAEADRALYGAKTALPADWVARAQEALAACRLPRFQFRRLFLPQNLWPFAAVLVLGLSFTTAVMAQVTRAGDPAAAYRKGEFTAAEQAWRERLSAAPTDWIARHNLSLALAQQERPGEAAAQAAAAFVQNPSHAAVRWHFALAAERMGAAPPALAGFYAPDAPHALGRWMSPADWQRVMILGAWIAAAAIGLLLLNAYGRRTSRVALTASVFFLMATGTVGAAYLGVRSYGIAADADAVVVARPGLLRSIPTEADTTQKTTPLAAGAMALADKSFLGWRRLAFENGQTGWVRKEDVVPLWK